MLTLLCCWRVLIAFCHFPRSPKLVEERQEVHQIIWYPEKDSTDDTIIKLLLTGTTEQCADAGWCVLLPCALILLVLAVFANSFASICRIGAAVLKGLLNVMKEHDILISS